MMGQALGMDGSWKVSHWSGLPQRQRNLIKRRRRERRSLRRRTKKRRPRWKKKWTSTHLWHTAGWLKMKEIRSWWWSWCLMENLPWRVNIRGKVHACVGAAVAWRMITTVWCFAGPFIAPSHSIAPGLQGRLHCGVVNLLWGGKEQRLN